MIVIKRENEHKLKKFGFRLVSGAENSGMYRYWLREMDDIVVKVAPFSVLGSLNDVSVIRFIPRFDIDVEAEDVYEKIEQLQHDYELYYSKWVIELVDKLIVNGIAEHIDRITDCVKKVPA